MQVSDGVVPFEAIELVNRDAEQLTLLVSDLLALHIDPSLLDLLFDDLVFWRLARYDVQRLPLCIFYVRTLGNLVVFLLLLQVYDI